MTRVFNEETGKYEEKNLSFDERLGVWWSQDLPRLFKLEYQKYSLETLEKIIRYFKEENEEDNVSKLRFELMRQVEKYCNPC